jgi:putative flippase GtrA
MLYLKNHYNLLIFKFFGVYGITYLCNLAGLAILKSFKINVYLGGAILAVPVGLLDYILNKVYVFKVENFQRKIVN